MCVCVFSPSHLITHLAVVGAGWTLLPAESFSAFKIEHRANLLHSALIYTFPSCIFISHTRCICLACSGDEILNLTQVRFSQFSLPPVYLQFLFLYVFWLHFFRLSCVGINFQTSYFFLFCLFTSSFLDNFFSSSFLLIMIYLRDAAFTLSWIVVLF